MISYMKNGAWETIPMGNRLRRLRMENCLL